MCNKLPLVKVTNFHSLDFLTLCRNTSPTLSRQFSVANKCFKNIHIRENIFIYNILLQKSDWRAIEMKAPHDIHQGAFGTSEIAPLMR